MSKKTEPVKQGNPSPDNNTSDALKARAREVFASHDVDLIYFTSDGTAFIQPQDARMHSENLIDPSVSTIKRQEV